MKSSANKIQMTSFQDLFQAGGEVEANGERVQEVPLSELYLFKDHPFQVRDDEAMQETADSIAKYGVLVPGIVRPQSEGGYEIVAGHRRKRGSKLKIRVLPLLPHGIAQAFSLIRPSDCAGWFSATGIPC